MKLVIDASVARAAGLPKPGASSPALESVNTLMAVRSRAESTARDVTVLMSPELFFEWFGVAGRGHAREFATKWYAAMLSSGLVEMAEVDPSVLGRVTAAADRAGKNVSVPLRKDAHLVALTLQSDRRLITNERKLRDFLRAAARFESELATLHFARPEDPRTIPWIDDGAPEEPQLQVAAAQG